MKRRISVVAALAVTLFSPVRATAQDKAAAEEAFRNGRRLLEQGKQAEACEAFGLSQKLDPAVGTLLNLANCHEAIGKTASAWAEFTEAADRAARAGQRRRVEEAKRRAQRLEPRLTRLRIRYAGDEPAGLAVYRNGADITLLLGTAAPGDPGEHLLEARAQGFEPWTKTVRAEGDGKTVEVEIPALKAAAERGQGDQERAPADSAAGRPADDLAREPPRMDRSGQRKRRYIALGVGGVGAASIATGLFFGLRARSKWNDAHEDGHCDEENVCDPTGAALVNDAKSAANVSTILVAAGTAAAIGGVILWLTAPSPRAADQSRVLRLVPGPGEAGVAVRVSF
jgi:hypothetical protein